MLKMFGYLRRPVTSLRKKYLHIRTKRSWNGHGYIKMCIDTLIMSANYQRQARENL